MVAVNLDKASAHWPLSFESSDVDWCESNFQITNSVAEFWNTISNFLFFILPPILMHINRDYSSRVSWGVNVVWALLGIVGVGSVYFHATLSLVGQLLDEIAIIWVVMAAIAMWYPKEYMPPFIHQDRKLFQGWVVVFAFVSTGLACVKPAINCVVLFVLGVPATALLVLHLKRCHNERVYNLGIRCAVTWVCAVVSWATDSLFCAQCKWIGFPYMHCFWHIFIALASYQAIVLFVYFDAMHEVPEMRPVMRYWPYDGLGIFGIPCVLLENSGESLKIPHFKAHKVL